MSSLPPEPFTIEVEDAILDDLRHRIASTRWPDEIPGSGWDYGVDLTYLKEVLGSWQEFDWRAQEKRLNRFSHFRVKIGDLRVHFIHEPGAGPRPMPLVLTHGWPSSFVEYLDLIPMLTNPVAYGGDESDSFTVVVPSLPGYGFSDRPSVPGMMSATIADLWMRLMTEALGYRHFAAHGSDIGAGVTSHLARRHPDRMIGIHLSAVGIATPPQPWSKAEADYIAVADQWEELEGAYSHMHATKPQTLGYGLNDSPAGLAAWILEKFRSWSDSGGDIESRFDRERLLTNLTLYWATSTITSSIRPYYEYRTHAASLRAVSRNPVPAGFAMFGNEFVPFGQPPRDLAERYFTVERWTELAKGGHFPALEEPALLAEEIRAFFRPLRS